MIIIFIKHTILNDNHSYLIYCFIIIYQIRINLRQENYRNLSIQPIKLAYLENEHHTSVVLRGELMDMFSGDLAKRCE
ncbi:Uncharacterised protein [Oligella ureolytica]|nr:Uncharacterised protein [Oligella ureolytica]